MKTSQKNLDFFLVEDPKLLLPLLEDRLPQSCFMYNQVKFSEKFKSDLKFYTSSSAINSNSWIVADYIREDYGHYITISAPTGVIQGMEIIPSEVKECFASGNLINWDENVVFVALEKVVSCMIFDINSNIKGNVTEVHPCVLFYMDKQNALDLPIRKGSDAKINRLNPERDTEFVRSGWKFAKEGSENVIRSCIRANASAGVFVDGVCASCAVIMGDGLLHCLHTRMEFRKRGFAKLTVNYAYKELAKDGGIPCSTVELKNGPSLAFHESLGVKKASVVDYIHIEKVILG